MTHSMTPRRALRLAHFVRAALSLDPSADPSADHTWLHLAADAEQWALASLAGCRTHVVVMEADGSAHLTITGYNAGVLARQVRALCGFIA